MSAMNGLWNVLTLHCEAASELSSRELDDPLPRLDRAALYCHLVVCRSCRRFRAQVRLIQKAVRRRDQIIAGLDPHDHRLSPDAKARILRACERLNQFDADAESIHE